MIIIPYENKMSDSIKEIFVKVVKEIKECSSDNYDFNLALRFICKDSNLDNLVEALIYDEMNVLFEDDRFYIKEYFILTEWIRMCQKNNLKNRVSSIDGLKSLLEKRPSLLSFIPEIWEPTEVDLKNSDSFKDYLNITFRVINDLNDNFDRNLSYDKFKASNRVAFLSGMDISVCPYCNKTELTNADSWSSADLDHFLPQSAYPLFSLSLGNIVPSCKDCNRQHKKTRMIGLNPRYEGFDKQCNFCLYTDGNPVNLVNNNYRKDNIEILFDINANSKRNFNNIRKSINLFKLHDIYNSNNSKKVARRLISNLSRLKKMQIDSYEELGYDKEEIFETQFNLDIEDFKDENYCNAPRGKFIGDILRSFKTEEIILFMDS